MVTAVVANPFSPLLRTLGWRESVEGMEVVDSLGNSVEMAAVGATLDGFLRLLSTEDVLSCEATIGFAFVSGGGVGSVRP